GRRARDAPALPRRRPAGGGSGGRRWPRRSGTARDRVPAGAFGRRAARSSRLGVDAGRRELAPVATGDRRDGGPCGLDRPRAALAASWLAPALPWPIRFRRARAAQPE